MMNLFVFRKMLQTLKRFVLVIKKPEQTTTIAGFAKIATKLRIRTGLNVQSTLCGFTKYIFIVDFGLSNRDISRNAAKYLRWSSLLSAL